MKACVSAQDAQPQIKLISGNKARAELGKAGADPPADNTNLKPA
jgi:hypothetical protein